MIALSLRARLAAGRYNAGEERGKVMSAASQRRLTAQEYLAIERQAATRSEFFAGEMFAMAGASFTHTLIKDNFAREIGNCCRPGPCRVLTSDQRIKVEATGLYAYPDIVIVCAEPRFEDEHHDTLLNPHVLVEVLSPTTEKYDRGTKFRHYREIPSLQEYLLVAQDQPLVERFVRQSDGSWLLTAVQGLDATLAFATLPVAVPLSAIYAGVSFPETLER